MHVFKGMPIITRAQPIVLVEEGSVAKVECPHWARPAARVEWYRDDTPISPLLLSDSDKARFSIGKDRYLSTSPCFVTRLFTDLAL